MSDVNSYELRVFTTLETAKEKLKLISLLWWVFKKGEASARIDAFSSSRAREKLIKHHFPCYTNNITFIVTSNFNKL